MMKTRKNYKILILKAGFLSADSALVALSLMLAYLIRFDFDIWPYYNQQLIQMLPIIVLIRLSVFYYSRSYQFIWRYSGINDLIRIAQAIGWGTLIWVSVDFLRNYQLGLLLATGLLISAFIHRASYSVQPDSRFKRNIILAAFAGSTLLLIGGFFSFIFYSSAPVSIHDNPFAQKLIPESAAYELGVPRAVLILEGILSFILVGILRISPRLWIELRRKHSTEGMSLLIYGAGDQGENVLRAIRREPNNKYRLVGFIDDDPVKQRSSIHGIEVLGTRRQLEEIVEKHEVAELLITITDFDKEILKKVVTACNEMNITVRRLPELTNLINNKLSIADFRVIDITDLLGRPEVKLDAVRITSYIKDRVVLVTGAGGSIGSELCRQISEFHPRKLILMGKGEGSIYLIQQDIQVLFPDLETVSVIGDIRNRIKVRQIFEIYRPLVVFHAAAHKHVPLVEQNVDEAILTNVFGTRNLIQAARRYKAEKFVMISTDKAVKPTSVMGASKRLAELQVQHLAEGSDETQFMTVRFGNVLGSRGSVVPLFEKQISRGGPVTITHPDMTRYFMSIPEAVRLVMHSAVIGNNGDLCILDMGEPVKILDLAENMIRMAGLKPGEDIEIVFSGIRPGEKLFEELVTDEQATSLSKVGKINICKPNRFDWHALDTVLEELEDSAQNCDQERIVALLQKAIPEYVPDATTLAETRKMKQSK
jgi:FlaA1/EpsC-like NDP-sugar epimerase